MARDVRLKKHAQIAQLTQQIMSRRLVYLHSKVYVHDKNELATPCPCCGSMDAYAYKVVDDIHLLIDPRNGTRKLRHLAKDVDAWDRVANGPTVIKREIKLTCASAGYDILMNTSTKTICVSGGARAGKSMLGLSWMCRQWMLKGGKNSLFWLCGPDMATAYELMKKFILGQGSPGNAGHTAPTLPLDEATGEPLLVKSYPRNARVPDQTCYMIDGSQFVLKYAAEKRLRGVAIVACLFTEAAKVKDSEPYDQLVGRLTSIPGAQMMVDSSPSTTTGWVTTKIFKHAEQQAMQRINSEAAIARGDVGAVLFEPTLEWRHLTSVNNPWLSDKQREDWRVSILDENMMTRELLGYAADDEAKLWAPVWNAELKPKYIYHHGGDHALQEYGDDITGRVCLSIGFAKPATWILGVDVNVNPTSFCCCKVYGVYSKPETWVLYVDKLYQAWDKNVWQSAAEIKHRAGGAYANAAMVIDPSACNPNPHTAHTGGRYTSCAADGYVQAGFQVLPAKGTYHAPQGGSLAIADTLNVCMRLMNEERLKLNFNETIPLQASFDQQIRHPGGFKAWKPAGSRHDKLSGPADAFRYVCWRIFAKSMITMPTAFIRGITPGH